MSSLQAPLDIPIPDPPAPEDEVRGHQAKSVKQLDSARSLIDKTLTGCLCQIHLQEMETDKKDEDKKKKGKVNDATAWRVVDFDINVTSPPSSYSPKMWFHQGEWEDCDTSRESETRDHWSERDNHHCE